MGDISISERPRIAGPGERNGDATRVIVRNDDHNTFEGVASVLARYIPGVGFARGMQYAAIIHSRGAETVWSGQREVAELYWEQLAGAGLTMAPLE